MPTNQLTDLKAQIKTAIRRSSDRGFVPYSGCNRVCGEMLAVMGIAEAHGRSGEYRQAFDIFMMVLVEAVKLISHADTSSGAAGDVIHSCLTEIESICQAVQDDNQPHYFNSIIKTATNKAFQDWPGEGYRLLKSAVYFVRNQRQAQKIYDACQILGPMYDGKEYPDKLLITHSIVFRLEGREAAEQYLMRNIQVPEIRMLAVENALAADNYPLAETLCREALRHDTRGYYNKPAPWA